MLVDTLYFDYQLLVFKPRTEITLSKYKIKTFQTLVIHNKLYFRKQINNMRSVEDKFTHQ